MYSLRGAAPGLLCLAGCAELGTGRAAIRTAAGDTLNPARLPLGRILYFIFRNAVSFCRPPPSFVCHTVDVLHSAVLAIEVLP